jgi:hypothetical protein
VPLDAAALGRGQLAAGETFQGGVIRMVIFHLSSSQAAKR